MAEKRKLIVEIIGDDKSLQRAFARSSRGVSSAAATVGKALAAAGVAVAGLGVIGVRQFGSFEQTLDRVVGLAGGAREEVAGFSREILRLGPQLAKSPQELAEALYEVASAGIDASRQMAVVEASARASSAGLGETKTVADAVTSAMAAYGQGILSAAAATDVLVATVREGKGEAEAFAPVVGNVAALAAQLGVSFNEVGAALAAQTRLGTDARTASVQLQMVFQSLLKTTPKAVKALQAVGLNADALREQLAKKGLLSVLRTLRDTFGDNTKAMSQAFPEIRALRGVLSLVGKNADDVEGVFSRMVDSTGALDHAFASVSEGAAFKFSQTMSSLRAAGIQLGAMFAPLAKQLADGANAALGVVNRFLERFSDARGMEAKVRVVFSEAADIGREIAQFAQGIQQRVTAELARVRWNEVGRIISNGLATAANSAAAAIAAVDWGQLGRQIVRGVADFLKGVNWIALMRGVARLMVAALIAQGKLLRGAAREIGSQIVGGLQEAFSRIGDSLKRFALQAVVKFLEPFEILGRFNPFAGLLDKAQKALAEMEQASFRSAQRIAAHMASVQASLNEGMQAFRAANASLPATAKAKPVPIDAQNTAITQGQSAVEDATDKARTAFEKMLDGLRIAFDRAGLTKGLGDDLKAINAIVAALRERVRVAKNDLDAQRDLVGALKEQQGIVQQMNELRRDALKASQFKALGLTATGEERVPGVGALAKRLGTLQQQVKGTILDTPKTRSQLQRIAKVLSGNTKKLGRDVRQAILQMFNDIASALENKSGKTPGRQTQGAKRGIEQLIKGLGLTPDQVKELRQRYTQFNNSVASGAAMRVPAQAVAGFGGAAGATIVLHNVIELDGRVVANSTTRHQEGAFERTARTRRGARAGR